MTTRSPHRPPHRAARRTWVLASGLALLLAGCASAPTAAPPSTSASAEASAAPPATPTPQPERRHWAGKLSVRIDREPVQYFSAGFELQGDSEAGEMQLFSPLGSTVATLRWQADGGAQWQRGEQLRHYPDMAELSADLTGTALPLASLFDWLQGRATAVDGWQVDLSQHASGKLQAQRLQPTPSAQLRLVFEP